MNPSFRMDLSALTSMTLKLEYLHNSTSWVLASMENMTGLQELKLWEYISSDEIVYPYQLFLDFWPCGRDPSKILPIFGLANRRPRRGRHALRLVTLLMLYQIDDIEELLFLIWDDIKICWTTSTFFPPLVRLDLSFWPENPFFWCAPRVFQSGYHTAAELYNSN